MTKHNNEGTNKEPKHWEIRDKDGKSYGKFKNVKRARNKVDKLDNAYGGYRHHVKAVYD